MPNALVSPYVEGLYAEVAIPLVDPRSIRAGRGKYGRDFIPELEHANCFMVPAGRHPARGWVLVYRSDLNNVDDLLRTDFQLQIDDLHGGTRVFAGLAIVQARCVTRGLAADKNAVYLVELTDARGVYSNRWMQFPLNAQYNVVSPAYPGGYYSLSMVGGATPWDWEGMVGDIWSKMPLLGTFSGLPSVPSGTPEDFIFPGVSAFEALCDILELLGMTIGVDLTGDVPYSVVQMGVDDTTFTDLQANNESALEDDWEWIDVGSGRVPSEVVVYFHRKNEYYGTEETVRNDSLQWSSTPLYAVTVAAPADFTGAQGAHFLWDDFPVQFDVDGNPLSADVTTATTIATERAGQYFDRIYWGTLGYMRQVYAGVLPFYAGSLCSGVRWYADMQAGEKFWRTEIVRKSGHPWPEMEGGHALHE